MVTRAGREVAGQRQQPAAAQRVLGGAVEGGRARGLEHAQAAQAPVALDGELDVDVAARNPKSAGCGTIQFR